MNTTNNTTTTNRMPAPARTAPPVVVWRLDGVSDRAFRAVYRDNTYGWDVPGWAAPEVAHTLAALYAAYMTAWEAWEDHRQSSNPWGTWEEEEWQEWEEAESRLFWAERAAWRAFDAKYREVLRAK